MRTSPGFVSAERPIRSFPSTRARSDCPQSARLHGGGAPRSARVWFVTEEMSQSTFLNVIPHSVATTGDANYQWLMNYNPTR